MCVCVRVRARADADRARTARARGVAAGARFRSDGAACNRQVVFMDDYNCNFILSNTDASIANALRKTIISEVPTICIDLVEIEESECPRSARRAAPRADPPYPSQQCVFVQTRRASAPQRWIPLSVYACARG